MFLTGKQLPRRTVLRGLGATIALPFLDSMLPSRTVFARGINNRAMNPVRLVCIEQVHGAAGCSEDAGGLVRRARARFVRGVLSRLDRHARVVNLNRVVSAIELERLADLSGDESWTVQRRAVVATHQIDVITFGLPPTDQTMWRRETRSRIDRNCDVITSIQQRVAGCESQNVSSRQGESRACDRRVRVCERDRSRTTHNAPR